VNQKVKAFATIDTDIDGKSSNHLRAFEILHKANASILYVLYAASESSLAITRLARMPAIYRAYPPFSMKVVPCKPVMMVCDGLDDRSRAMAQTANRRRICLIQLELLYNSRPEP